jgi:hypothetical protein
LKSVLASDRPIGQLSDDELTSVERHLSAGRETRFGLLVDFTTNLKHTAIQQDKNNDTIGLVVNYDQSEIEVFLHDFVRSLEDILDQVIWRLRECPGNWPKDVATAIARYRPPPEPAASQPEA